MNHEDNTIDMIDQLMAQGLDDHGVPLDDYSSNRYDKCVLCQHDWHGTSNDYGCPGAWAGQEDQAAYRSGSKSVEYQADWRQPIPTSGYSDVLTSIFDGIMGAVSGVVDLLRCPDVEPGTVLASMPSQIHPPNGEPVHGMLTVTAQAEGYAINFCPTESSDSVDCCYFPVEHFAAQGFSTLGHMEDGDENADVAP